MKAPTMTNNPPRTAMIRPNCPNPVKASAPLGLTTGAGAGVGAGVTWATVLAGAGAPVVGGEVATVTGRPAVSTHWPGPGHVPCLRSESSTLLSSLVSIRNLALG